MRAPLLLAALAALAGCDDESIPARVATAQLYGVATAQVTCVSSAAHYSMAGFQYQATRLADGSCFASVTGVAQSPFQPYASAGAQWNIRGSAGAETCAVRTFYPNQTITAEDGILWTDGDTGESLELSTCDGFNLEAFGVEP